MFIKKIVVGTALFLSVSVAFAYPRHDPNVYDKGNLWSITFHDDDSVAHNQWATQRICFLPYSAPLAGQTQIKGTWYSTTYPNWHGHYRQEGDSVKMVGNFWSGKGNDSMTWDIVTSAPHTGLGVKLNTLGAGHWTEWGDNGSVGPIYGFGNALFQRVGYCKAISTSSDVDIGIKARLLSNGREAEYPQQLDQLPLEGANELEELFEK